MDKEQALKLKTGDIVHTTYPLWPACDSDRSNRWKVNGKPVTYKRKANEGRWRVPIKHGMYSYDNIDADNVQWFHREDECPHGR